MSDGGPYRYPCDQLRIQIFNSLSNCNVVDGVVEKRNETSNSNDSKRLCRECTKDNSCQRRSEEAFINPEVSMRLAGHVKLEGKSWEQIDEEDPYCASKSAIIQSVL